MPNITSNSAPIYSADLLYEQNGKCGETVVLTAGETWTAGAGSKGWKFVVLANSVINKIAATNIHASNQAQLEAHPWLAGQELMANFTEISVEEGIIVVYMDCLQS